MNSPLNAGVAAPKLLGKQDVMNLLDVSDRTLEKLVNAKKFPPPLQIGRAHV